MNIEKFRSDLRALIDSGVSQVELERLSGVKQCNISKILNWKDRDVRLSTVISLWPHIYGCDFPAVPERCLPACRSCSRRSPTDAKN